MEGTIGRQVRPLVLLLMGLVPLHAFLTGLSPWFPLFFTSVLFAVAVCLLFEKGRVRRVPWSVVFFSSWLLLEVFLAVNWDRSFEHSGIWLKAILLGFIAHEAARVDNRFRLKICLLLWVVASLVAAFNPGWQAPPELIEEAMEEEGFEESFRDAILHAASQGRHQFPYGNPNHLGLLLALSLLGGPLLYRAAVQQPRAALMMFALALSGLVQAYVLWGTKSRTAFLALIIGGVVGSVIQRSGWRKTLWVTMASAGVVLFLVLITPSGREMASRIETVQARFYYWQAGLKMIRDYPWFGLGIGGYGDHYTLYRPLTPHQTEFAHQIFLEVTVETGAVGLALFLLMGSDLFRSIRAQTGSSGSSDSDRLAIHAWGMSVLVAFLVSIQVDFPHNRLDLLAVVCLVIGSVLGAKGSPPLISGHGPDGEPDQSISSDPNLRKRPAPPSESSTFVFGRLPIRNQRVLIVLAICAYFPTASREIAHALYEQARAIHLSEGKTVVAANQLEKSIRLWPPFSQAAYYLGRLYLEEGFLEEPIDYFHRAIRWNPTTAYLREDLAKLYWRVERRNEAMIQINEAIRLHPLEWKYHATKARFLFESGQPGEAARERSLSESLKRYEPRYRQALEAQREAGTSG